MDPIAQRVLALYDQLERDSLDHALENRPHLHNPECAECSVAGLVCAIAPVVESIVAAGVTCAMLLTRVENCL